MAKQFAFVKEVDVQALGIGEHVIVGGRAAEVVYADGKTLRFIADQSENLRVPDGRIYRHAANNGRSVEVVS
jgi:hypothetical protein